MIYLYGTYNVTLDLKKRLAIPAPHRAEFPEDQQDRIFLTHHLYDPCITGFYEEKWFNYLQKIDNLDITTRRKHTLKREIIGNSKKAMFDKQGRITIPMALLERAQLENANHALVIGCGSHLEIWSPEVRRKLLPETQKLIQEELSDITFD
jgi:MraZ protein